MGFAPKVRFAPDSSLEGDGFELSVPRQRISVYRVIRSVLARDRGVGADVSVQPGFVIIMPSPLEAAGAPLCCSPVELVGTDLSQSTGSMSALPNSRPRRRQPCSAKTSFRSACPGACSRSPATGQPPDRECCGRCIRSGETPITQRSRACFRHTARTICARQYGAATTIRVAAMISAILPNSARPWWLMAGFMSPPFRSSSSSMGCCRKDRANQLRTGCRKTSRCSRRATEPSRSKEPRASHARASRLVEIDRLGQELGSAVLTFGLDPAEVLPSLPARERANEHQPHGAAHHHLRHPGN
jgi:hypothetical protein